VLLLGGCGNAAAEAGPAAPQRPRISADVFATRGLQHFYNLEFNDAAADYKQAQELEPQNPQYWAALADSYLFQDLLLAGRLDSQLYSASNAFLHAKPVPPAPALTQAMWEALGRARSICAKRLRANPRDADAHYALGLTYAIEANYDFSVARKYRDALHASAKAKEQCELARQFDPSNHDANLVIGAYEYAVGSVPGALRWLLYLAGYTGSKELGVELIQDAMLQGKESSSAAAALLAVIYNRERMYSYARQMLRYLVRFFPRNYLAELEIGGTYLREGRTDDAITIYKDVAQKTEGHAPGFARVDAGRLYFQIASLLEKQHRASEALSYYERLISQKEEQSMLSAQAYLRMGDIWQGLREQEKARGMYEEARKLPFPEIQRHAEARLRALSSAHASR